MKHILTAILLTITIISAKADQAPGLHLDITLSNPGTLAAEVGRNASDATVLDLAGPIDVRDIDFIAASMPNLSVINLTKATIQAYTGRRHMSRQQHFEAGELPSMAFAGIKATSVQLPSSLVTIGDGALAGSSITTIAIPSSVTEIRSGAFATCNSLTAVTIPANVTTTGAALFRDCTSLVQIYYNAPRIPANAFAGCHALTSAYLGNALRSIGSGAFADCSSLTTLSYSGNQLREIGSHAFRATALTRIDLSSAESLSSIGSWAFADNTSLTVLILPKLVYSIGDAAFFNNSSLTDYSAPTGFPSIGDAAFKGAGNLDITNPAGDYAQTIGRYAFRGMSSLSSTHLPSRLTSIGDHAFEGCTSLRAMNGPELTVVPQLGNDVWPGLDKPSIFLGVPEHLITQFKNADQWREFNIQLASTDEITIGDQATGGNPFKLSTAADATSLTITANMPMTRIMIHDITGRLLADIDADGSVEITADTSRWQAHLLIISAIATDGQHAAAKSAH